MKFNNLTFALETAKMVNVFIIDDSLFSLSQSKAVELLARVFDHVDGRYVRGFRMLTLGWSDGNTFLPLAFSLLSSEKEANRLHGVNDSLDKQTPDAQGGHPQKHRRFTGAVETGQSS